MASEGACVGCRVVDTEGYKATVRYIGPVVGAKNQEEVWFGVEWDNPTRGKHDGSSVDSSGKLHRYFHCAHGSGSFIKPAKVAFGRTFLTALNERYVNLDAPTIAEADGTVPNVFVSTLRGNQKSIEFVGEDKIRKRQQVSNVTNVAIRNDTVSSIEVTAGEVISHLQEIDLQDNLLWNWTEVATLGSVAPNISVLLLHNNKMQHLVPSIPESFPTDCFACLRVLALNSCGIKSWGAVQLLSPHLPVIEELYLASNSLPDLPRLKAEKEYQDATGAAETPLLKVSDFETLRLLDLSNCGLDEWSQVAFFGDLPSLQELILDNNPLPEVQPPVSDSAFPRLHRFSLSSTKLSTWQDVNFLAKYPHLRYLRLSTIPLFTGRGSSEVRPEVIGRIPQLAFFNGSQITPRERSESEKNYLRAILFECNARLAAAAAAGVESDTTPSSAVDATATAPATSGNTGVASSSGVNEVLHPRFAELMSLYGADLVPATKSNSGPTNLAAELVSVTFKNLSFLTNGSLEPITKKIPRSLLIGKLQLMVKQLFGLDPRLQHLSMRVHKDAPPVFLDDEKSSLQYYGVVDGAEIFVNEAKAT